MVRRPAQDQLVLDRLDRSGSASSYYEGMGGEWNAVLGTVGNFWAGFSAWEMGIVILRYIPEINRRLTQLGCCRSRKKVLMGVFRISLYTLISSLSMTRVKQ